MPALTREQMARRACQELREPLHRDPSWPSWTVVGDCIHPGSRVIIQRATGAVSALRWASTEDVADASSLRDDVSEAIDVVIIGAHQISERGDLASTVLHGPGVEPPVLLSELLARARHVVAVVEQGSRPGAARLVHTCGASVLGRGLVDRIISELAVIDVTSAGLFLREVAPGMSARDVQDRCEPLLRADREVLEMSWS